MADTTLQTRMPPEDWQRLLRQAAIIYDLDGVVVDVRATYRQAYLRGIESYFRLDLGLPRPPLRLAAVHLLKRHRGFNDPAEVTAILLRLLLRAHLEGRAADSRWTEHWIAAALSDGRLDDWRPAALAGLEPAQQAWVTERENLDAALALVREQYVGSAAVAQVFGTRPRLRVLGLARRDRRLADPRAAETRPIGVYSGRTFAEIQWIIQKFERFSSLTRAGTRAAIEAVDTGAHKPDGAPLLRLAERLGRDVVLYIGDLQADRLALLDARRRDPQRTWLLGQVLAGPRAAAWAEADAVAQTVDDLIAGPACVDKFDM
ncbi:MAG: hypothetical protein HY902_20495 [Deltaproteobacteria bacterium]|nr:hypothetical protein [Deltaproteobacteria bacterium]